MTQPTELERAVARAIAAELVHAASTMNTDGDVSINVQALARAAIAAAHPLDAAPAAAEGRAVTEHCISLDFFPATGRWMLREPYVRETSVGTIAVPAGFSTDLASTPWQVWKRYPKLGPWTGAAVVHDWLYRERPHSVSRKQADAVFLELLRRDGVPIARARWMHGQVRLWGSKAWNA